MAHAAHTSGHWSQQRERGSLFAMKLLLGIAALFGLRTARALLYPICLYFMLGARSATRASRQYLMHVFGRPPTWQEVFRHYHTFATVLFDRAMFHSGRSELFEICSQNVDLMRSLEARRCGAVMIGAHLGAFDVSSKIVSDNPNAYISMLMYENNARKIQSMFEGLGGRRCMQVIPLGQVDTLLRAKERLDAGGWVGIMADRAKHDESHVRVPFLGESAAFPLGPFLAASALRTPVVLFFCVHLGGNRYREHFELLAEEITVGRRTRAADLEQWVRRYAQRLEYYCRLYPYNWFNFYDFWAKTPAAEVVTDSKPAVVARSAA